MQQVDVKQYATRHDVSDEITDPATLDAFKRIAADDWRTAVQREGCRPFGEPSVEIIRRLFPEWAEDPDTGESFKLPDRAIRVIGRVVPLGTPEMPEGFDYQAITLPRS